MALNVGGWTIDVDASGSLVISSGGTNVLTLTTDHVAVLGQRVLRDQDPIYLMKPDDGTVLNATSRDGSEMPGTGWAMTPYWRNPPGDGDSNLQVFYGNEPT